MRRRLSLTLLQAFVSATKVAGGRVDEGLGEFREMLVPSMQRMLFDVGAQVKLHALYIAKVVISSAHHRRRRRRSARKHKRRSLGCAFMFAEAEATGHMLVSLAPGVNVRL